MSALSDADENDEPCLCWTPFTCLADEHDDTCDCGHALNWHDMGHGCIECRCRGFQQATP